MQAQVHYLGNASRVTESRRDWIIDSLIEGMPRHEIENYFNIKRAILEVSSNVSIAEYGNHCVGLIALSTHLLDQRRLAYIETFLVAEEFHRSSIAYRLLSSVFNGLHAEDGRFPDLIAMRTYNPLTYVLMRRFGRKESGNFYPTINDPVTAQNKSTAILIANRVAPDHVFDSDTGIVVGASVGVSRTFWRDRPYCKEEPIDDFFYNGMTPDDRVLCFIDATELQSKSYAMKKLGISQ